jgi:hypothetical protein
MHYVKYLTESMRFAAFNGFSEARSCAYGEPLSATTR